MTLSHGLASRICALYVLECAVCSAAAPDFELVAKRLASLLLSVAIAMIT
jgi:hypothetical protein